ncbi:MAG: Npt1/Npt2 family nucleotide transporter [Candidatus Aminicenantales bacterium]
MKNKPLHKLLSRVVEVRQDEVRTSLSLFVYFFLITTCAYIIKPVKISLFLEWLTFERLPYAYLITACLIGFVVTLNARMLQRLDRTKYVSASQLFFLANLLVFWWLFRFSWRWLSLVFWVWADIFTATSVTQFWILVNDAYHPRQAKRLIGFLVSGGLLGGVVGALLASVLSHALGTENLLLVCPFLLAVCLLHVRGMKKSALFTRKDTGKKPKEEKNRYRKSFQLFVKDRHLVLLAGIMAVAIVVTTLIDFQFGHVVQNFYPAKDTRTAFLGTFFTLLLVFSYLLHVLATSRILKTFDLRTALVITPSVLLLGSAAVFLVPASAQIFWAVSLKGADKSLTHSLSQSVRELLYIPVSPEIKYRAKVFIDMFVNKVAKGFGAVLLLVFYSVVHLTVPQISLVVMALLLVWIALNWRITQEYVGIVKRHLQIKWQNADKHVAEKIDVDLTKLVFDTMESRNRSSVLYAMNLFDLIKSEKLSPELKRIIACKSDEIQACSMDSLLELDGESLLPEMDDAIDEASLNTQVREIMSLDVYQELIGQRIDRIARSEKKEPEVARMEAAKILGLMDPDAVPVRRLTKFLRDESAGVVRYALESVGKLKKREFVPWVVPHLKNPVTQRVAAQALVVYGSSIVGMLKDYLSDRDEDIRIRKAIPEVLFRIGSQRAADLMTRELKKGDPDVEAEIIEALFKLRGEKPDIHFEPGEVIPEILALMKKSHLLIQEIQELLADRKKADLASDLETALARSLKQIFELLSLIYPYEDILRAYSNISAEERESRDYAIELLDNVLKREIKEFLFPLIEDVALEEKVKKSKKLLKALEKAEMP